MVDFFEVRNPLQHACTGVFEAQCDGAHFSVRRADCGRQVAIRCAMNHRACRRKAERTGFDRITHEDAHFGNFSIGCRFALRAAITHHIDAQRAVRNLRGHVNVARAGFQYVEIIAEAFPIPCEALGQRRARNVFDAFHQADQRVVVLLAHRREADAAIAHDHRCRAMNGRRRHALVPCRLTIVMRVNIDPARRHEMPARVDLFAARGAHVAHRDDHAFVDGHIRLARRVARAVDQCAATDNNINL